MKLQDLPERDHEILVVLQSLDASVTELKADSNRTMK